MVPVFKNLGEKSTAKSYYPVSLLSVVSNVFERLVNNRIVHHLEKCMLVKQKESLTSQKLGSWDFWQIADSVLKKSKSATPGKSGKSNTSSIQ